MKINIAKSYYQDEFGNNDLENSLLLCGKFAGVCYDKFGYDHIKNEETQKTLKRIELTKNNGHHSVYDHVYISFNISEAPKILAMVLNNEHQYTTSEKSARYTKIIRAENDSITEQEEMLYNKWLEIFKIKIKNKYGNVYDDNKIRKLAQENARYLVTVFMPTTFIYTTSLRQINYIVSWFSNYIKNHNKENSFEHKLALTMETFILEMSKLNVLDEGLMQNEKFRSISLFSQNIMTQNEVYDQVYQTKYKASFAEFAQAQRHRTIYYSLELMDDKEYFIPPIILDDQVLVQEWIYDINSVKDLNPQGELVNIFERGTYEAFILKCKERLCSAAQLEIMRQTRETLLKYYDALKQNGNPLADDMKAYLYGARCTFPDFACKEKCGFKEGINLTRKI